MDFMEPMPKDFLEDVVWMCSCEQRSFFTEAWHKVFMISGFYLPSLYQEQRLQNHSLDLRRVVSPVKISLVRAAVIWIVVQVALKILWKYKEKKKKTGVFL